MKRRFLPALAFCGLAIAAGEVALAQDDQQLRCLQLQQELASARRGGGGGGFQPGVQRELADAKRVYRGTKAAMEDAGCFSRFLIFGEGLVRNPKCLKMNARAEDARRRLERLQDQSSAGGGGNRRHEADLRAALARNGCGGGQMQQSRREQGGGGLFGWFGRGGRDDETRQQQPAHRSIDPGGRYRSVCVRMCDGFFFPISHATYASHLSDDASMCQSNCAAPAELYVYHNPGGDISQAISLNGAAYAALPNAFRYRKEYVKGCSCKEAEYSPTEIEASGQKAEGAPATPGKTAAAPAKAPAPEPAAEPQQPPAELDLSTPMDASAPSEGEAPGPDAAEAAPEAPQEAPPADEAEAPIEGQQSTVAKRRPAQ